MKIALIGINSKYIHKNLAVHSLYSYVKDLKHEFFIREFAVNEPFDSIFHKLNREKYDVLAFSVYLWNRDYVLKLSSLLKKLHPNIIVVLGGPDISVEYECYDFIDYLVIGEGELVFRELISTGFSMDERVLSNNGSYLNLNELPFVYEDSLDSLKHKIVYYEGSRGCPFHCSYCLSGNDNRLRLKNQDKILEEIGILVRQGVRQVKFIDRTFNANPAWAKSIVEGLLKLATFGCNFHFEVSLDKMDASIMKLLHDSPDGLFQLEIGIQTTNESTLKSIRRHNDFEKIKSGVKYLLEKGNMHLHTDLIAGLPFEDLRSFKKSFNTIYSLKAQMLQVGFLKVIPNTTMHEEAEMLGITYREYPPYEVVETRWLSADDLLRIKYVECAVDGLYNKKQFRQTLGYLLDKIENHFDFYGKLGRLLYDLENPLSLDGKFSFLADFVFAEIPGVDKAEFLGVMRLDWLLNNKNKNMPLFLRTGDRLEAKDFIEVKGKDSNFLKVVELPFLIKFKGIDHVIVKKVKSIYIFDYSQTWSIYGYPRICLIDKEKTNDR